MKEFESVVVFLRGSFNSCVDTIKLDSLEEFIKLRFCSYRDIVA